MESISTSQTVALLLATLSVVVALTGSQCEARLAATTATSATVPTVVVLSEAKCPNCVSFLQKELNQTLSAPGVLDSVTFEFVPWGNAYYDIAPCGSSGAYDKSVSFCWIQSCQDDPDSCFDGPKLCQHGNDECLGNAVQMCAIEEAGRNPKIYMPFILCFEGEHDSSLNFGAECARRAGVNWQKVQICFQNTKQRHRLEQEFAMRTVEVAGTSKLGTPWVIVDGQAVANPARTLSTICTAIEKGGAALPTGCDEAALVSNEPVAVKQSAALG